MFPFRCNRCKKIVEAPSARLAQCCGNAPMTALASICLLIDKQYAPNHTTVFTIPEGSNSNAPAGTECVTACNSPRLPPKTTAFSVAATCPRCLAWVEKFQQLQSAKTEAEAIEDEILGVEFIDEENPENSFSTKIKEIKKNISNLESSDQPSKGSVDEILSELKNLHDKVKIRKMQQTRYLMKQEFNLK